MISQAELSIELARLGYPTSVRTLTDWRHKGLLPKFRERRRGKNVAHHYCWRQPHIVQHAYCLADALAHNVTAERAALLLVFAGFEIDAKVARRIWLQHLGKLEDLANPPREDGEYADDHVRETGIKLTSQLEEFPGVDKSDAELLTIECLKAIYPPEPFHYRSDELHAVASAATAWIIAALQQKQVQGAVTVTTKHVYRTLALLRLQFGFSEIKALVKSSSIAQFQAAVRCHAKLVAAIESILVAMTDDGLKSQIAPLVRAASRAIVGPAFLTFALRLIQEGHGKRLEKSEMLLDWFLAKLEESGAGHADGLAKKVAALQRATPNAGKRFLAIWKNFDLFRLYHLQ